MLRRQSDLKVVALGGSTFRIRCLGGWGATHRRERNVALGMGVEEGGRLP
jgi:hypothetical protein